MYKTQVYFELVLRWQVSFCSDLGSFTEATGIADSIIYSGAMCCIVGNGLYRLSDT